MQSCCPFPCDGNCAGSFGPCDIAHVFLGAAAVCLPYLLGAGVGLGFVSYELLREKSRLNRTAAFFEFLVGAGIALLVRCW